MKSIKITANKIIIAIFVLFCIFILAAKLPCSYTILSFELGNTEEWTEAVLSVNGENGVISEQTGQVHGNIISFSVIDYYLVDNLSVDIMAEEVTVQSVKMSSRNHVVYNWDGDNVQENIIYCDTDEGKTSFTVSDEFINRYNQIYGFDWRLKADILIPIAAVFLIFELAYIIVRKTKLGWKGLGIIVALSACGFSIYSIISNTTNQTYLKVDNYVENAGVTSTISGDEVYEQGFYTGDNAVCGLAIRFATYGTQISGDYILKIYDTDTEQIVAQKNLAGSSIKDNQELEILFGHTLEKNHNYYFCVTSADADTQETLVMWMSNSDQYEDGTLYEDNLDIKADIDFNLIVEGPKSVNWMIVFICIFGGALIVALLYHQLRLSKNLAKLIIYVLIFVFCLLKMSFYCQYLDLGIFDETAQISYIAYLDEVDGSVIPDFEDMTLLMPYNRMVAEDPGNFYPFEHTSGVYTGMFTGTINYLGHPPLYYSLMRLTGSFTSDENYVYVNVLPLRLVNMVIVSASIAIMFYIGYTRIKRKPIYHLLFAMICTSVPLLCYEACMISNDNFTLLAVVIFILGALRFTENKIGFATYFILAIGIALAMLTKTTAGILVLLTAVIFLVWTSIKERNLKLILNKYFAATLPIYILTAAYFIIMYFKYGTFQPSLSSFAYDQYLNYPVVYVPMNKREILEFWDMVKRFYDSFIVQWQQGTMWQNRYIGWANIGTGLLWIIPVVYAFMTKVKKQKERLFVAMTVAIFVTVGMQFIRAFKDFQYISGHAGTQSRYYLCVILIFAMIVVDFLGKYFDNSKKVFSVYTNNQRNITVTREKIGIIIAVVYCTILFYSDVIYNLMNSTKFNY